MLIHSVFSEFLSFATLVIPIFVSRLLFISSVVRQKEGDVTSRVTALLGFCLITATWVLFFAEIHGRCSGDSFRCTRHPLVILTLHINLI